MKIGYVSDLHLHFNRDAGPFSRSMRTDVDVQIVAGDVCDGTTDLEPLRYLAHQFKDVPLVFVPGNHEHFFSTPQETEARLKALEASFPNLHVLISEDFQVPNGPRIIGTTLWYRATPEMAIRHMTWADFRFIDGLVEHTNERFLRDNDLLESIRPNDIVVTHMLPSWKCVDRQWEGARTNELFVRNVEPLIPDLKPSYWIHGHTHCQVDVTIGETRVLCNPRGTLRDPYESCLGSWGGDSRVPENPRFDKSATLVWEPR